MHTKNTFMEIHRDLRVIVSIVLVALVVSALVITVESAPT